MKRYNTFYYLLFVLLIMGAFASMAQNDYGITILGLVAVSFSLLFAIQLIYFLWKKEKNWRDIIELTSLTVVSGIMAMRVFYFHFIFVEIVFAITGVLVVLVYLQRLLQSVTTINTQSKKLAQLVLAFYSSIVLYTFSMVTVPFYPVISELAGAAAFALLIVFLVTSFMSKDILYKGEKVTGFGFVTRLKDRSIVLISLYILFTVYMGFTKIGWIPNMYSDEFPQSYYLLVNQSATGNEKPVDGKFRHEKFKEQYDLFIERNITTEK